MNHHPSTTKADASNASAPTAASRMPRPVFMGDPANDAVWDLVTALTNELGATRARLDAMERVLAEQQTIQEGVIDNWVPDEKAAKERTEDYQAYIARVFNTLTLGR